MRGPLCLRFHKSCNAVEMVEGQRVFMTSARESVMYCVWFTVRWVFLRTLASMLGGCRRSVVMNRFLPFSRGRKRSRAFLWAIRTGVWWPFVFRDEGRRSYVLNRP